MDAGRCGVGVLVLVVVSEVAVWVVVLEGGSNKMVVGTKSFESEVGVGVCVSGSVVLGRSVVDVVGASTGVLVDGSVVVWLLADPVPTAPPIGVDAADDEGVTDGVLVGTLGLTIVGVGLVGMPLDPDALPEAPPNPALLDADGAEGIRGLEDARGVGIVGTLTETVGKAPSSRPEPVELAVALPVEFAGEGLEDGAVGSGTRPPNNPSMRPDELGLALEEEGVSVSTPVPDDEGMVKLGGDIAGVEAGMVGPLPVRPVAEELPDVIDELGPSPKSPSSRPDSPVELALADVLVALADGELGLSPRPRLRPESPVEVGLGDELLLLVDELCLPPRIPPRRPLSWEEAVEAVLLVDELCLPPKRPPRRPLSWEEVVEAVLLPVVAEPVPCEVSLDVPVVDEPPRMPPIPPRVSSRRPPLLVVVAEDDSALLLSVPLELGPEGSVFAGP